MLFWQEMQQQATHKSAPHLSSPKTMSIQLHGELHHSWSLLVSKWCWALGKQDTMSQWRWCHCPGALGRRSVMSWSQGGYMSHLCPEAACCAELTRLQSTHSYACVRACVCVLFASKHVLLAYELTCLCMRVCVYEQAIAAW